MRNRLDDQISQTIYSWSNQKESINKIDPVLAQRVQYSPTPLKTVESSDDVALASFSLCKVH